jgi:hypothetical protein
MTRTIVRLRGLGFLLGCLVLLRSASARGPAARRVDFNRDIRPIFSNHCFACHGPDKKRGKAGLRLDNKDAAFQELKSGRHALVPRNLDESELYQRVSAADENERMPPKAFGKPLSKEQVELIRRWIEQGAEWKGHWAYSPPRRPPLPAVQSKAWPRNGIDYFILARLEREGLQPSPEADRATLLRRLSFDLTGLPPTPAELDAFLADQRPAAYEKVVDRLLASPTYGERMAQSWLDLARYADTNGYHIDNHREMWKWRGWVIAAFNRAKPFDQFTIEQLAGDMLPRATLEQKIASGFNRNTMVNFEGGADPNEYLTKYVIDRLTTTATVWMGTTFGCCECHDHKYDPFTQKEFYQFYAFFNNVPEQGLDGQKENPVPSIRLPSAEQKARLAAYRKQIAAVEARIAVELAKVQIDNVQTTVAAKPREPREHVWVDDALPAGAVVQGNEGAASWKWVGKPAPVFSGKLASVRTAEGLGQHVFVNATDRLRIGPGDKLFAYVFLDAKNPPKEVMLQFNDGSWEHRAYWGANLIDWGVDKTASRIHKGPLPAAGKWVRLEVDAQAVGLKPGAEVNGLAFTQYDGTAYWDRAGIVSRNLPGPARFDSLAAWEEHVKATKGFQVPGPIVALINTEPKARKEAQQKELRNYFARYVYPRTRPVFEPLNKQVAGLRKAEANLVRSFPTTMVMEEMPRPRDTFILIRGDFQRHGEKVAAGVPKVLPPLPRGVKADRLGLARWLVDPGHPLTSRVTVNRYWAQFFGTGLVKTSQDFGVQGEWPSHPELLDWLATEFIAKKWDVKAFVKMIVLSATYRQSARVTPDRLRRDPANRLLARGPRFRLSAEMIRDNALAVSGLLNPQVGGPSIRPYQPPGLWEAIAFGGGFSSQAYVQSKGRDLYRRGLYIYGKRSMPHPSLATFDAPNREVCTDRRPRTNTPLQALTLLNDPIYVECARVLGQRVMREGGATTTARLTYAFRLCTARLPDVRELAVLRRVYDRQRAHFKNDVAAARKLVSTGEAPRPPGLDVSELAAWTAVGNVLLNLDETITKG